MSKQIKKILIANRGEIACRVIKTARKMGIKTVAIYSDADKNALHVEMADEAVHIGPAPATESYLKADKILKAAQQTKADAVHPGYGFLSENADFARACAKNKIIFIGPSSDAIIAMGSKSKAKSIMEKAGVPTLPGYHGSKQDATTLKKEAAKIGYPLLIKAVAGGGGKGMKLVESAKEFDAALKSAKREGKSSFGNDQVLLEKFLTKPRHVEVQVFSDTKGNHLYLYERDCSLQRRHQKVVEEAPAPGISPALRKKLGETAVKAAKAIDYTGAGTIEFLMDEDGKFYFMEMNTRLQVEHPVTEMITGLDLVEWQIIAAEGKKLPLAQKEIPLKGHAVEVRIYAEDPVHDFRPETGDILGLSVPKEEAPWRRFDSSLRAGDEISSFYDPMIGKLICHGKTRNEALQKLHATLQETRIVGVTTNTAYLQNITGHQDFIDARIDTGFLGRHHSALIPDKEIYADIICLAAFATLQHRNSGDSTPWTQGIPWRMNHPVQETLTFLLGQQEYAARINHENGQLYINKMLIKGDLDDNRLEIFIDGRHYSCLVCQQEKNIFLSLQQGHFAVQMHGLLDNVDDDNAIEGSLIAPITGMVVEVNAKAGDAVTAGKELLVMEAMKTEYHINAPANGKVEAIFTHKGDHVEKDAVLIDFQVET